MTLFHNISLVEITFNVLVFLVVVNHRKRDPVKIKD